MSCGYVAAASTWASNGSGYNAIGETTRSSSAIGYCGGGAFGGGGGNAAPVGGGASRLGSGAPEGGGCCARVTTPKTTVRISALARGRMIDSYPECKQQPRPRPRRHKVFKNESSRNE